MNEKLDIKRLADALRAHDRTYAAEWRAGDKAWTWERKAADIAAEYARLARLADEATR